MEHFEKKVCKYVVATMDTPTLYLHSLHYGRYEFVDDIEMASKTLSRKLANQIVDYYHMDVPVDTQELVVVPVNITYDLVEEE